MGNADWATFSGITKNFKLPEQYFWVGRGFSRDMLRNKILALAAEVRFSQSKEPWGERPYDENEVPHPHDFFAFGFTNTNCCCIKVSW